MPAFNQSPLGQQTLARWFVQEPPASAPADSDFASVSLLCQFNGANNATTSTDSSSNAHALTFIGDAKLSTAASAYQDGSSLLLDGTGDYVTAADSATLAMGSGAFTMEAWVRMSSVPSSGSQYVVVGATAYNGAATMRISSDRLVLDRIGDSAIQSIVVPWAANRWYHIAITRDSANNVRFFVDGLHYGGTQTTNNYSGQSRVIGANSNESGNLFNGYIDSVRLTKGVARYAAAFMQFGGQGASVAASTLSTTNPQFAHVLTSSTPSWPERAAAIQPTWRRESKVLGGLER